MIYEDAPGCSLGLMTFAHVVPAVAEPAAAPQAQASLYQRLGG